MNTRAARGLLIAWGFAAAVAAGTEMVRANAPAVGSQWAVTFLAACGAGAWATAVQPGNRAARALLVLGCTGLTWVALSCELVVRVASGGAGYLPLTVATQIFGFLMVAVQLAALVRYPDGRRLYPVEDWLVWGMVGVALVLPYALLVAAPVVVPAWMAEFATAEGLAVPEVASPWHVASLAWLALPLRYVHDALLSVGPLVGAVVVAARCRRLAPADRQRLAWPLLAVVVAVVASGLSAMGDAGALPRALGRPAEIVSWLVLPVAMGIGIAAPGLFDAHGAVRRTLSYLALSALALGLYVVVAGALGATVGGDDLWVAAVVAVVAALVLDPVRRSAVRRVERLAYGEEVSRDELLLRLGDTLDRTLDRRALTESIAETALEGLRVQWARLEVDGAPPVHVGRATTPDEKPALSARLVHAGEDLGTIACGPSVAGRPRSRQRIQLETLGRQVATALANARLAERLVERLHEVDASRQQLLRAEQIARRRLERDLREGAQRDLAALVARIALARNQFACADLGPFELTLQELGDIAGDALRNLHELVSGSQETALADRGLAAAVEGRAARLPIPVEVSCGPGVREGRLPAAVESTAYFTVCEALTNTLEHGGARHASVGLALGAGGLHVLVADDGCGFDPDRVDGAGGLTGLRDRLAEVGGSLDVRSVAGRGTTVIAVVPTR